MRHRPKPAKTDAINACRRVLAAAGALLALAAGTAPAKAHMEIMLDSFGEAVAQGIAITELDHVWVAIYGSEHVDLSQARKQTLRLGSRDSAGASARTIKRRDVDGDGYRDLLARFDVAETTLREAEDFAAVLTLGFRDGPLLTAYDTVVRSDDLVDSCTVPADGVNTVGVRCEFTSSIADFSPLNFPDPKTAINEALAASASTATVGDSSAVVVEPWGGKGHDGENIDNKESCGGDRGYAQTVLTAADLKAFADDSTDLDVYVAEDRPGSQDGGGGGGSSWARQATVDASDLDDLVLGSSHDPSYPAVVLTFQVVDRS